MSDEKKEVKQSSLVFDIIVIIIGAIAILLGISTYIFESNPSWWPFTGPATANFEATLGGNIMLPLGIWVFISGIALIREKAWALGSLFVCFTLILYSSAKGLIFALWAAYQDHELTNYALQWANWVVIVLVVVSFIGFFYLLITQKRYH